MFDRLKKKGFEISVLSHAEAILERDFPAAVDEIEDALIDVQVPITEIIGSGGGETKGTQRMRKAFAERGWRKTNFEIKKIVNGVEKESISHEIDHASVWDVRRYLDTLAPRLLESANIRRGGVAYNLLLLAQVEPDAR